MESAESSEKSSINTWVSKQASLVSGQQSERSHKTATTKRSQQSLSWQSPPPEAENDYNLLERRYLFAMQQNQELLSRVATQADSILHLQNQVSQLLTDQVAQPSHTVNTAIQHLNLINVPVLQDRKFVKIVAMLDTGANSSLIQAKYVPSHLTTKYKSHNVSFGNGERKIFNTAFDTYIQLNTITIKVRFLVTTMDFSYPMLIGIDILNNFRPYFFTTTTCIITKENRRYELPLLSHLHYTLSMVVLNGRIQKWIDKEAHIYQSDLKQIRARIEQNCSDDPQQFWEKEQFLITLPALPIHAPMKATHLGMTEEDTKLCQQEIQELLKKDLIEPSSSNWACPAFYVNKHNEQKRGKKRLVINYKALNQFLIPLQYPLPLIPQLTQKLLHVKVFSSFDLKSGFWQFRIHPDHRAKTAFSVPQGLYQWKVISLWTKSCSRYMSAEN